MVTVRHKNYPDVALYRCQGELRSQNLSNVFLESARLMDTNLEGVNLSGASLRGANLTGSNLRCAKLPGVDLSDAKLSGTQFQRANLEKSVLTDARLYGTDFTEANLSGASLKVAGMYETVFRGADLRRVKMRGMRIYYPIDFTYANLRDADLSQTVLLGNFLGADLTGANVSEASMGAAENLIPPPHYVELSHTSFLQSVSILEAHKELSSLRKILLDRERLPSNMVEICGNTHFMIFPLVIAKIRGVKVTPRDYEMYVIGSLKYHRDPSLTEHWFYQTRNPHISEDSEMNFFEKKTIEWIEELLS